MEWGIHGGFGGLVGECVSFFVTVAGDPEEFYFGVGFCDN